MISRSSARHRLLRAGITAVVALAATTVSGAPANDTFAARTLLSGGPSWYGSTAGAGAVDEVDEKLEPSPADHASVWYEWIAPRTDAWQIMAGLSPGAVSGLAAYIMPAGGNQIADMEPAGACIAPPDTYPSISLAVQSGQRVILRVWTVTTPAVTGRSFTLTLTLLPLRFDHPGRSMSVAFQGYTSTANIDLRSYSTEPEDARLETGRWAPSSAAEWFTFNAPAGVPRTWQLSLLPDSSNVGRCEVLRRHPDQPGRYQSLVPPGTALQFTPVPGEKIYLRVSTTLPFHSLSRGDFSFMLHWPSVADERASSALSLQPGSSIWANLHGATPSATPLPVEDAATVGMPDIWVRLAGLSAGDRYNVRRSYGRGYAYVQLYRELPEGSLEAIAAGYDMAFTALPVSTYFVRIVIPTFFIDESEEYANEIKLNKVTAAQPSNDEWTGAIVLQAPTPEPIRGDLQGATASAAEAYVLSGTPPVPTINPRYRSVWYALDLPASGNWHGISAWGNRVTLFTASPNGVLTQLPPASNQSYVPLYRPNGSRIYAMVQGGADRFLLMVTPFTQAGGSFQNPIPLVERQPSRYFANWAPADPGAASGITWHSWTARGTGKYHVSSLESAYNVYDYAIYAGPSPFAGPSLNFQTFAGYYRSSGKVLTFEATGGTTYLIRTIARMSLSGPAILRVSPAKGASPYTFWRQSFPAWDDFLEDPLADPDGDGSSNLLELAAAQHPGFKSEIGLVSETVSPPGFSVSFVSPLSIDRTALSGPPGCTPFLFTAEKSSDLQTWQNLGEISRVDISAGDPFRFVRFRVSR